MPMPPSAAARPWVRLRAAGAASLAPLLAASRAVVTVNSTVALDAAVLGVPALSWACRTTCRPFVDAGVMAGGSSDGDREGSSAPDSV